MLLYPVAGPNPALGRLLCQSLWCERRRLLVCRGCCADPAPLARSSCCFHDGGGRRGLSAVELLRPAAGECGVVGASLGRASLLSAAVVVLEAVEAVSAALPVLLAVTLLLVAVVAATDEVAGVAEEGGCARGLRGGLHVRKLAWAAACAARSGEAFHVGGASVPVVILSNASFMGSRVAGVGWRYAASMSVGVRARRYGRGASICSRHGG